MDEVMCCVQGTAQKAQVVRLCPLSLRMGMVVDIASGNLTEIERVKEKAGMIVAKIIEFYVPANFRQIGRWVPVEQRGKVIEFVPQTKKSA